MGLRGPSPQPTAIKIANGNPGKRALNHEEPKPPSGLPVAPEAVANHPAALRHWEKLAPMLHGMGVLTKADQQALGNLCFDMGVLEDAQAQLAGGGALLVDNGEKLVKNPILAVINETALRVQRGLREFGLTPSSRSGIKVAPEAVKDEWAMFDTPKQ